MKKSDKDKLDFKYMKIECEVLMARNWLENEPNVIPYAHKFIIDNIKNQLKLIEKELGI